MIWRFDGDMMKSLEMKISEIWNFNQLKLNFCTFWSFVKFSRQFYSIPCWFSFKLIDLSTILKINCNADPLIAISHCSSFCKEYFPYFSLIFSASPFFNLMPAEKLGWLKHHIDTQLSRNEISTWDEKYLLTHRILTLN